MTTAQAAKRLGVSPQTVQKWVDAGYLPAWKTIGGHRRLDADAVERMALERRSGDGDRAWSTILVEDNPVSSAVLEAQLQELRPNTELRVFSDGFSALLSAGRQVPDLLVTDIDLPGLDGIAMVRELRKNPATQRMRIVLVTAHSEGTLARFGSLPEGVTLLHKPVSLDALSAALDGLGMRRKAGTATASAAAAVPAAASAASAD